MRARALFLSLSLLLLLSVPACRKPTGDECRELCERFAELSYFDNHPEPEAKTGWEEVKKRDIYTKQLDNCVMQCRFEGGTKDQVACVKNAKTGEEARACLADDDDDE